MMKFSRPRFGWRTPGRRKGLFPILFAATVVIAYLGSIMEDALPLGQPRGAICLGLGCVYALLGVADIFSLTRGTRAAYVAAQAALLAGIFWTSRLSGDISLCVYPLVGLAMGLLQPAGAATTIGGLYFMTLAVEYHFYGLRDMERWGFSLIASFAFVVVFVHLALRAEAARVRAEALASEVEKLAVIQERNRLAREIHDSLGHFLTTIHVQLEAAQAVHPKDPQRALEAVARAKGLAADALVEVRRSVGALRADLLAAPLPFRLQELTAAADGCGVAVSFELLGSARALSPAAEHALFRAAQEGLTNVRKHARARIARLGLDYRDPGRVIVRVTDDGQGGALQAMPGGHGLPGLRERIVALGGTVETENCPSGGFQLHVQIPA